MIGWAYLAGALLFVVPFTRRAARTDLMYVGDFLDRAVVVLLGCWLAAVWPLVLFGVLVDRVVFERKETS